MSSRGARVARGAAIAAFAVLAASLAHTVGGGRPPGMLAIVLALAFGTPIAMVLVGRRTTRLRAAAAALAAQVLLHVLYALGSPTTGVAGAVDPHALHAGGTIPLDLFVAVDHGHAGMPVAHVVAAALTLAFLSALDRSAALVAAVAAALAHGIRFLGRVLGDAPAPVPAVARPVERRDGTPDLGIRLLSSLRHRGPPAALVAA
ncbi:hypothetical protein GCM10009819_21320 [Agromyces tropicus]|uniref:MFS transporter n=1 Tax=Agromyces tropicus TaxID=555371 RepID=A0ABN2UFE6_9MICO